MKILGIIAEYNPFHTGHKYHLEKSKKDLNIDYTIAIMSGSFVQRGEPGIFDKWTRAQIAVESGVDLVIELPYIFAGQTAEIFAFGAVNILDSLNCIDYLSFGSEHNNIEDLDFISTILSNEPEEFKLYLKENIKSGYSYPRSRELALEKYLSINEMDLAGEVSHILSQSNNILAIEYLKALKRLKSKIKPHIVERLSSNYKDQDLSLGFSSATAIRNKLLSDNIDLVEEYLTDEGFKIINSDKNYNNIEYFYDYLIYKLISLDNEEDLFDIFDIGNDLGNRILNNFHNSQDIESFVNVISNKNFTKTRVQRSIFNFLLDNKLKKKNIFKEENTYVRILSSNKKGFKIINKIKESSDILIVNRFKDLEASNVSKDIINIEKKSTNLFYLGRDKNSNNLNMDYRNSPYILKS